MITSGRSTTGETDMQSYDTKNTYQIPELSLTENLSGGKNVYIKKKL